MDVKKKKQCIVMFKISFILLVLLYLNSFVGILMGNGMVKVNFNHYTGVSTVYQLVTLGVQEDFGQNILMTERDFAFCMTDLPNPDKKVELLFKGKYGTYSVSCPIGYGYYEKVDPIEVIPNNDYNMIGTEFSTVNMRNGTYELYVYVYENEENYGLLNTGRLFQKEYASFSEIHTIG